MLYVVQMCALPAEEWGIFSPSKGDTNCIMYIHLLTKIFRNSLLFFSLFPSQLHYEISPLQLQIYTPFHGFRTALHFMKNLTQWHWALENQITQHHSQSHHTWSGYEWITLCYHFPLISLPTPRQNRSKAIAHIFTDKRGDSEREVKRL